MPTIYNYKLTKREIECLQWLNKGKTMEEIGIILGISHRTVKAHIDHSKRKLDCYTLFQLGREYHKIKFS